MRGSGRKRIFHGFVSILLVLACFACGDNAGDEEDRVKEAVRTFFTALAERDTALAKSVMMKEGWFYSVREDGSIRAQSHTGFFETLAREQTDFLERMWDPTVLVHDRIAVLWTPYDFHRDGRFSHCGIDAFSLIRVGESWKITGTIYTVQHEGCPENPQGSPD